MIFACVLLLCTTLTVHSEPILEELLPVPTNSTSFLSAIVGAYFRELDEECVHIRTRNGNQTSPTLFQNDVIDDITRMNGAWMLFSYSDLSHRPAYYNIFLVRDYSSLAMLLAEMNYTTHQFYGFYLVFIEQLSWECIQDTLKQLWSYTIINVVLIVKNDDETYVAYSYQPYEERKCAIIEPIETGRYTNGTWDNLNGWFPDRFADLHGCPMQVGVVEVKPYSMIRLVNNRTVHYGLEVYVAEFIASRLNFTINYVQPSGNIRWGILHPTNSTGLVGMLQRKEVSFGFGSLGYSLSRYTYLKMSTPSHLTQMIMAIPPKRPYTSLEKLFQPFTIGAWVCIAVGYTSFGLVTYVLMKINRKVMREKLRHPIYSLWVLLMGGSSGPLRMDSTRMFMVGFILNTLVIRTLYQAGMFQRLQASESLAADLNTISAINKAGLRFNMFRSTMQFYKDNPMVPVSRIKVIQNDLTNWDDVFYQLHLDRLGGVLSLPLDSVAFYVKQHGKQGVVYPGKYTGFTYSIGILYPKTTPLQDLFDGWILRLHASGLIHFWTEEFRDNRYWTHAKEDPEPASLKWNQISGGFFLCGALLLLATLVFFGELIYFRLRNTSTTRREIKRNNMKSERN